MNMPTIETERLILRRACESDLPAMLKIYGDEEVMRFVPIFPAKDMRDMEAIWRERWQPCHEKADAMQYLICLKETGEAVGYVHLDTDAGAHDLGYGIRKDLWHKGIASEAAAAVLREAKKRGIPFATATHDRENPHSGGVMRKIGMTYRYSYREQWMPKDISVVFRMYQIPLADENAAEYDGYRRLFNENFVENFESGESDGHR